MKKRCYIADLLKKIESEGYMIRSFKNGPTNFEPNTVVGFDTKYQHIILDIAKEREEDE